MDRELQQLLGLWLNNEEASETALRQLRDRIQNDDEFRAAFVHEIDLLGDLRAVQTPQPKWLALRDKIGAANQGEDFESRVVGHFDEVIRKTARQKRFNPALLSWLAAAVIIFGGVTFYLNPFSFGGRGSIIDSPPEDDGSTPLPAAAREAVAMVSRTSEAVWSDQGSGEVAHLLSPGTIRLDSGLVQLDFFGGAHVVIDGATELEIQSPKKVVLLSGNLSCRASEFGRGFTVATAQGDIAVQETAFAVSVTPGQPTEIHVVEGAVTAAGQRIEAGHSVKLDQGKAWANPYRESRFIENDEFDRRAQLGDQRKLSRWHASMKRLSADPDVLLHYTMEGQDRSGAEIRNQARTSHEGKASSAMLLGTTWTEGRWSGKSALHFSSEDDRLLAKLPGAYGELTFMIWARIDALTQTHTAFILTENPERWALNGSIPKADLEEAIRRRDQSKVQAIRWTAQNRRESPGLNLAFREKNGGGPFSWDTYPGDRPVFSSSHWGDWACYAVTYSATEEQVIHYYNGKPTTQITVKRPSQLLLDYLEIGNLSVPPSDDGKEPAQYRFYGLMDEILIAKRVFSPAEIREIFQNGAP